MASISLFLNGLFCVFSGVSDSEIVDPSMEELGDNLNATGSEEEQSDSEEEQSDSEEEPGSAQCGTTMTNTRSLNRKTSDGM